MAENGSCIVHVENGSIEKLAESGLDHAGFLHEFNNARVVFAMLCMLL